VDFLNGWRLYPFQAHADTTGDNFLIFIPVFLIIIILKKQEKK
jgi:hypothetical protein